MNGSFVSKKISTSISDNQIYPNACLKASNDYGNFTRFRKNSDYQKILEHVTVEQGRAYISEIIRDTEIFSCMDKFMENDRYGGPELVHYPEVGEISPTTLRYVKVLADLKKIFGSLDGLDICEIGVGYGGQCRVINSFYRPGTYCLVDIKPALMLAQRYLDNYILHSIMAYKTMNELGKKSYDLVISNYAFTELPRTIQDVYLDKIVLNTGKGYITYNEVTLPEFNAYGRDELVRLIPGARVIDEVPLTGKNNCIIVWGADG